MSARHGLAWRYALLIGLASGLALAAVIPAAPPIELLAVSAASLVAARHLPGGPYPFIFGVAACAALVGLALGSARLAAIDRGALSVDPDTEVALTGAVESSPRLVAGHTRFIAGTGDGRIMVVMPGGAPPDLEQGGIVTIHGVARGPMEWEKQWLRRDGVASVVVADVVRATVSSRDGPAGTLDGIRQRAEAAIERGNPESAAALLRGFVLGQDDQIAELVRDDFRRSGLAHVLIYYT